jgi:hypothetical protein
MRKNLIIIVLITLLVACTDEQKNGFNFNEFWLEFQSQKADWENLQIDHYRYTIKHATNQPQLDLLLTITVFPDEREPEITAINRRTIADATKEELIALDELLEELYHMRRTPLTITQLFSALEWQIQSTPHTHKSPHFEAYEVVYCKDYHFPKSFFVRYVKGTNGGLPPTIISNFEDLRENM